MTVCCWVPYCTSLRKKKYGVEGGDYVSFHEFPSNLILREKWLKAICKKDFAVNDISDHSRVCSKHFKSDDFNIFNKSRRLKPGSIPSVFPTRMQTSSRRKEPIKIKLEPSEMMEIQERDPDLTVNEETSTEPELIVGVIYTESIPPVFDGNHPGMQTTASSSGGTEPNIWKSESSEMMEAKVNESYLTAIEKTSAELEHTVSSLKEELRHKNWALEVKSKRLSAKILEVNKLKRQLKTKSKHLQNVTPEIEGLEKDLNYYTNSIHHKNLKKLLDMESSGCIEPKQVFLLTQLKFMFSKAFRWPESVLKVCNLLQAVSPYGYRMLIESRLLNLPSRNTLIRYTGNSLRTSPLAAKFKQRSHSNIITCCHHRVFVVLY